ncbi:iron complex transport system permease protein [Lysinibacillus fusiformis]|uniref:Iron complex transport system permease protein n=2 Tax=Bacillaceae TaxID=186817 RepID=A0A1H9CS41_9BACI|nr:iron complex transport system permease protein [Lysinibacillus fusiformis]SCY03846.1 iron complex transport system permease protein [Lysinibacillus fusiformis]SDB04204.1 iron complex transport system permease protein [Lysinibacillus fusiformis]SEN12261.1 iron complex transport system permease protein [Lysinibacillus fusiformis]SEQ04042.1 iron complex transport system permease protein [Lysinibacillus fusiformis]
MKSDRISFQIAKRTCWIILLLSLLLVIITIIGLSAGSDFIHPFIVVKELLGYGNGEYDFVLHTLRLPRILMALLVGAALGVAGLILQGIIRNPLAAPDIIGVTSGASMGAIIFIVYFMGSVGIQFLPLAAISGAAIISFIIYLLSWRKGVTPIRMVLIGIGISALAKAVVTMLLVISEVAATTKAYLWLTGSLYGANMTDVYLLLPWVALLLPLTFVLARTVNVKELGDDIATGLGVKVQVYRLLFLLISVMLAGSAVAFAGGIAFVGLVAPHMSRLLVGRSFAGLIPVTAIIGGIIVIVADIVARTAFLPKDLPTGVFTAAIGAPFFIYLLFRTRNQ